ncbi:MAG: hypothetical protein KDC28_04005 [Saprospiraceae bacterium]|nr:hypothetical protein [Saprospiraceae bacterium]MCB9319317.1 hypothetical protein [Lewinellaceae bacterium]
MTPNALVFCLLALIVLITVIRFLYYKANLKVRQEQTLFLLDKFSSPAELTAFLQSEDGKMLLQLLGWHNENRNLKTLALVFQILAIFVLALAFCIMALSFFAPNAQAATDGRSLGFLLGVIGGGSYLVHRLIRKHITT